MLSTIRATTSRLRAWPAPRASFCISARKTALPVTVPVRPAERRSRTRASAWSTCFISCNASKDAGTVAENSAFAAGVAFCRPCGSNSPDNRRRSCVTSSTTLAWLCSLASACSSVGNALAAGIAT